MNYFTFQAWIKFVLFKLEMKDKFSFGKFKLNTLLLTCFSFYTYRYNVYKHFSIWIVFNQKTVHFLKNYVKPKLLPLYFHYFMNRIKLSNEIFIFFKLQIFICEVRMNMWWNFVYLYFINYCKVINYLIVQKLV